MSRSGIVNVRMVITEEKILSNIEKIQKLINPNSKKQIVQLEEDSYFKDLIESIKTYLIEYPKKKNFPLSIYKATYGLVEFATIQFEENTKKIEELIKQREENIALSEKLKEVIKAVEEKDDDWVIKVDNISDKFSSDITRALNIVGVSIEQDSQEYVDAMKLLKARVNNLESNLHIEIDMERLEDSSKALSYIGIEIAEALKLIPTPDEQIETVVEKAVVEEEVAKENIVEKQAKVEKAKRFKKAEKVEKMAKVEDKAQQSIEEEKQRYKEDTTFEAKKSLWQRFKESKIVKAATYIFRIKIKIELPTNALPEGNKENI